MFLVHNRVRHIQRVASKVRELLPDARILVAHGQMDEDQLESVMLDFADHKGDVLVCTTIIESGLDIPNANTIIINNADRFRARTALSATWPGRPRRQPGIRLPVL